MPILVGMAVEYGMPAFHTIFKVLLALHASDYIKDWYWCFGILVFARVSFHMFLRHKLEYLLHDMHRIDQSIGRFFNGDLHMKAVKEDFNPVQDLVYNIVVIAAFCVKNQYMEIATTTYVLADALWALYTDRKVYRRLRKAIYFLYADVKVLMERMEILEDEQYDFGETEETEEPYEDVRNPVEGDLENFDLIVLSASLFIPVCIGFLCGHFAWPVMFDTAPFLYFYARFLYFYAGFHLQHILCLNFLRVECQEIRDWLTSINDTLRDNEKAIPMLKKKKE